MKLIPYRIQTRHEPPPIPCRNFDWLCYDDNTYDGPGSVLGCGPTREDAMDDFWAQWVERYGD